MSILRIEFDIHGATLWASDGNLTTACLSDGEVDAAIAYLKSQIDVAARDMKKKIRAKRNSPLDLKAPRPD
jgi:hypothetical protein